MKSGVLLVLGPERFLARRAVDETLAARPDAEVSRLRGGELELAALLDDLRTPSLFGGFRVVVVDEANALWDEDELAALADYAERPAAGSLLLLVAPSLDRRRKQAKRLATAAEVVRCDPMRPREFPGWITEHARRVHGLRCAADAVRALRKQLGDDLGRIDAALERLKEQIGPRTDLIADDVLGSTEDHRSPVLFEASNALEERQLARGLDAVGAAFAEGVRIHQDVVSEQPALGPILLSQLHRTWTRLLRFHMALRSGLDPREAAKKAGASEKQAPFFLEKARLHRLDTLVERHRHFAEADLALKRSGADSGRQVLETLLLKLLA